MKINVAIKKKENESHHHHHHHFMEEGDEEESGHSSGEIDDPDYRTIEDLKRQQRTDSTISDFMRICEQSINKSFEKISKILYF